jgi:hypothetical protein
MKKTIIKIIDLLPFTRRALRIYFLKKHYLKEQGWMRSAVEGVPVDAEGKGIPWLTYSFIHFIEQRLTKKMNLLEYGSGNSTFWFASRVGQVTSVEHHKDWYAFVEGKIKKLSNVDYLQRDLESKAYEKEILNYENQFHLILVDGRKRVECAKNSINALTSDGVVIWDNSDRDIYQEGYDFLIEKGFKRLDFFGLAPSMEISSCTSVFYRPDNCLGL